MARSTKMVIAKSSRGTSRANVPPQNSVTSSGNPSWSFAHAAKLFGLVCVIGSTLVAYDTLSVVAGREIVNLAISASVLIAIAVWIKRKFSASGVTSPEENLADLETLSLQIAAGRYHPVSARNTAMRTAKDLIILRAALESTKGK